MSKTKSFMQRFGRQHVNRYQTLLRPAWNQFHTTLPLISDRGSRRILVLVRSEILEQFVNTLTADYQVISLESGEVMVTDSRTDISGTEHFLLIFLLRF